MLIMQRKAIAEALMFKFREHPGIRLIYQPDYHSAQATIEGQNAKVALIEVTESGPYDMEYCLALCKRLRKNTPECKLLLMVPEQDEESIKQVVNPKGKKLIDDFVFYDVTMDYLTSKLLSI